MSELLKDAQLVKANGDKVDASTLKGKLVALYFSAHWCPPCRQFTPTLKDVYEETCENHNFEVVFVSSDDSQEQMKGYMDEAHGGWLAVSYDSPLRDELKRKYGVCAGKEQESVGVQERRNGIPSLVVLQPDGRELSFGGCQELREAGPVAVKRWRAQLAA
uniref:Thioredoxin domain-containing protein n=1 Tax=Hemiselmis tepida TaxID=464990 RepID=A0A7S0WIC9_9CRYP|mmetsp:Transcript_800/g.1992  ORF Transcript_800/g.1992 Transcript_800/m.1992 type:complete len:161 (+) Transcript_800:51-533(+)|eukprot:CAMPEP_0174924618 /NCGR_PEP_ID=MMETSP1355-20121228/7363_1 /TAXON_ID=464990 /ORGANISM="Hemiselmis tepida, Strain CCMP443" /LENGTH=160 /DNA_ID=CAMNT_0016170439 /DNA_START=42 /DNA_END=524 /DNA_ORIENTATION=-